MIEYHIYNLSHKLYIIGLNNNISISSKKYIFQMYIITIPNHSI